MSNKKIRLRQIKLVILIFMVFLIGGCNSTPNDLTPIEPLVNGEEGQSEPALYGRFAVINPEMAIFDLDTNRDGTAILFSSAANTVSLLNEEGSLQWEISTAGQPVQTKISSGGEYISVGTDEGVLYYFREVDQQQLWEKELEQPVYLLEMTPDGKFLFAVTGEEDSPNHYLYSFDDRGRLLWQKETLPINNIMVNDKGNFLFVSEMISDGSRIISLDESGEIRWTRDNIELASISKDGNYIAGINENELIYLRSNGENMWHRNLDVKLTRVELTTGGNKVAAYSSFGGGNENLFFFDKSGQKLWEKRVPDGSLIGFAPDGNNVVISSWQQYSDDFSEIIVIDQEGRLIKEVEISSRVEYLALSENGCVLALAGSDGNIYILGLAGNNIGSTGDKASQVYYLPVSTDSRENETEITLFFYDEKVMNFIPVTRWVPQSETILNTAIGELIKGPRCRSNLARTIPKEAKIEAHKEGGTVYIDLLEELTQVNGSAQVTGIIDSLLYTVSQFPGITEVQFLVKGEKEETFGGEGLMIDKPFKTERFKAKGNPFYYLPYKSGERYYLYPKKISSNADITQKPRKFMERYLIQGRFFFPTGLRMLGIEIDDDKVTLDLSQEFKNLFPKNPSRREKDRTIMILDSLILTIVENFPPNEVSITVGGKIWKPPEGYPELQRKVERPFFINPES